MTVGTVKWFSNKKGYGFITLQEQENERDVFVHYSGILGEGYKTLNEGDQVEFELVDGDKGPAADQVKGA